MSAKNKRSTGAGAATSAGIYFEQQLGSLIGSWILTGRPLGDPLDLGDAFALWMRFETEAPVDDILVATSAGGFVAIQAKTSVSLSSDPTNPFGKTISQFVRQWLACRDGDGSRQWDRPLDAERDRLVLAVSSAAPANVRTDLPAALRLAAQPGGGELNQSQQLAFTHFTACAEQAWGTVTQEAIPAEFARTLARFARVIVVDFEGTDREVMRASLANVVKTGMSPDAAINGLTVICGDMMRRRGGADLVELRRRLAGFGIGLKAPPQYQADIDKIIAHSVAVGTALSRYEEIEGPDSQSLSIERDCQTQLTDAAKSGSLLITGEPGAGKSAVLNRLARTLREEGKDVVELAVDRHSIETLEGLRIDLGLEHMLGDALAAWDGEEPAWVIIDALDAARGGKAEAVFRRLIEDIIERDGRWKVVASIRNFDLRMGQQYRSLFQGKPPVAALSDNGFPNVRHVQIPTWTAHEFETLLGRSPPLADALKDAPASLRDLASVPFNTRLIGDLLKDNVLAEAFSGISSQIELLQLYWDHRVEKLGAAGRMAVKRVVDAMIETRTLRANFDRVAGPDPVAIDELAHEGVITIFDKGRGIQFRHHILFDFAASRTALDPDAIIRGDMRFPKDSARGLMLAPALAYLLEEIWNRSSDRADFWSAVARILDDRDGDPVLRSATARIAAEFPRTPSDIDILAARIVGGDLAASNLFNQASRPLAIRLEDDPEVIIEPWVVLLHKLAVTIEPVANPYRFLLYKLMELVGDGPLRPSLGAAARALLAFAFDCAGSAQLITIAIDLVGKSFGTEPAASRALLERVFTQERLAQYAHEEVPAITREIANIASADPDFGVQIFRATYDHQVSGDMKTQMGGSRILSLTSNARQDYDLARYSLEEYFPAFLKQHPLQAVEALVAAVEYFVAREHPLQFEMPPHTLRAGAREAVLQEDLSHIWAHNPDNAYGHDSDVLVKKLLEYLKAASESDALAVVEPLLGRARLAIIWSRLFLIGALRTDRVLDLLLPWAMNEACLLSPDTRKDAADVVAKGYDQLNHDAKRAFELAALEFDFSAFRSPEGARDRILRRLFATIGPDRLATAEARAMVRPEEDEAEIENERPFVIRTFNSAAEPFHWIEDLDRNNPPDKRLMEAIEACKALLDIDQPDSVDRERALPSAASGADMLTAIDRLRATIDREANHARLVIYAEGILAQGLKKLVRSGDVPPPGDAAGSGTLWTLFEIAARSAGPPVDDDTEARFEESASWGSPSPRVEAAEIAFDLTVPRADLYDRLAPWMETLLADPHPAVRLQAVLRLIRLWELDNDQFWRFARARMADEQNLSVLHHSISGVLGNVVHAAPDTVEDITLGLIDRLAPEPQRQARIQDSIANLVTILWVGHARERSKLVIDRWIADPVACHKELVHVLSTLRSAFAVGLHGKAEPNDALVRHRAIDLTLAIVTAASDGVDALYAADVPSDADVETAQHLARLLDAACREIYFAADGGRVRNGEQEKVDPSQLPLFLREVTPILMRLGESSEPHTIYYLLQLLEFLLPHDPENSFDLMAHALLRAGKRSGYHFESLGTDVFVRMVGRFLADHKSIFEDDARRTSLINCLEIFMDAGWPAAHRLLYRLPELIQ